MRLNLLNISTQEPRNSHHRHHHHLLRPCGHHLECAKKRAMLTLVVLEFLDSFFQDIKNQKLLEKKKENLAKAARPAAVAAQVEPNRSEKSCQIGSNAP
jgi:hypothetical protein